MYKKIGFTFCWQKENQQFSFWFSLEAAQSLQ